MWPIRWLLTKTYFISPEQTQVIETIIVAVCSTLKQNISILKWKVKKISWFACHYDDSLVWVSEALMQSSSVIVLSKKIVREKIYLSHAFLWSQDITIDVLTLTYKFHISHHCHVLPYNEGPKWKEWEKFDKLYTLFHIKL